LRLNQAVTESATAIAIRRLLLQRLIMAIAMLHFLKLVPLSGAGSGQAVTDRRFVFAFPTLNLYEVIMAATAIEARHKLMNSSLAPFYGQAVLLNP
jgi:hypothetical protein